MYIRLLCIKQSVYAYFMQNTTVHFAQHIRFFRLIHTVELAYTYISVARHIRERLLKVLFQSKTASFLSGIFVRIYVFI